MGRGVDATWCSAGGFRLCSEWAGIRVGCPIWSLLTGALMPVSKRRRATGMVAVSLCPPWAGKLVAEIGPRHSDHRWAERYLGRSWSRFHSRSEWNTSARAGFAG